MIVFLLIVAIVWPSADSGSLVGRNPYSLIQDPDPHGSGPISSPSMGMPQNPVQTYGYGGSQLAQRSVVMSSHCRKRCQKWPVRELDSCCRKCASDEINWLAAAESGQKPDAMDSQPPYELVGGKPCIRLEDGFLIRPVQDQVYIVDRSDAKPLRPCNRYPYNQVLVPGVRPGQLYGKPKTGSGNGSKQNPVVVNIYNSNTQGGDQNGNNDPVNNKNRAAPLINSGTIVN